MYIYLMELAETGSWKIWKLKSKWGCRWWGPNVSNLWVFLCPHNFQIQPWKSKPTPQHRAVSRVPPRALSTLSLQLFSSWEFLNICIMYWQRFNASQLFASTSFFFLFLFEQNTLFVYKIYTGYLLINN